MLGDQLFQAPTCLPCHRSYTALGTLVAEQLGTDALAFGYTRYQSAWPEQTPYAIERLTCVLASRGIRLELPVYDIASKAEAIAELARYCLSTESLEQKCLQQQFNVALDPAQLKEEIVIWEHALRETLAASNQFQIETVSKIALKDLSDLE